MSRSAPPSAADPAPPERANHAPLDRRRPLILDQLLADRPRERLKGLRAAHHPQPRASAQRSPDQPIAGEATPELAEIVIHAECEAHSCDAVLRRLRRIRARPEPHPVDRRLIDAHEHRILAIVQQPFKHPPAPARHPVPTHARGKPERVRRAYLQKLLALAQRPAPERRRTEQVHVDEQRAAADDLQQLRGLPGARVLPRRPSSRRDRPAPTTAAVLRPRRCASPTTAAPATNPPAATAAAWTAGIATIAAPRPVESCVRPAPPARPSPLLGQHRQGIGFRLDATGGESGLRLAHAAKCRPRRRPHPRPRRSLRRAGAQRCGSA